MTEWSLEAEGITNLCMPWVEIGNLGREEIQLVKIFLQMKRVWQIIDSTSWRLGQQCNNEFFVIFYLNNKCYCFKKLAQWLQ